MPKRPKRASDRTRSGHIATRPDRHFKRLTSLPIFSEIHKRLAAGVSVDSIVHWLQDELELCKDVSASGLKRQLFRYKKTIPLIECTPRSFRFIETKAREYGSQVNILAVATRLCQYQMSRLEEIVEKQGDNAQEIGKELDRTMHYIERLSNIKHSLGLLTRGIGAPELEFIEKPAPSISDQVIASVVAKHGPRAVKVLEQFGRRFMDTFDRIQKGLPLEPPPMNNLIEIQTSQPLN